MAMLHFCGGEQTVEPYLLRSITLPEIAEALCQASSSSAVCKDPAANSQGCDLGDGTACAAYHDSAATATAAATAATAATALLVLLRTPSTACPSPRSPPCLQLEASALTELDELADKDFAKKGRHENSVALPSVRNEVLSSTAAPRPFASLGLPSWVYEPSCRGRRTDWDSSGSEGSVHSSPCSSRSSSRSSSPALSGFCSPREVPVARRTWADLAEEELEEVAEVDLCAAKAAKIRWADLEDLDSEAEE
mmetsp:Transcript_10888/g.19739  ORF Transcript_10888/g.19739 Transcript_10888/m.19739 type:complete len:251 (+) Transcript_10888:113-865(+)